MRGAVGLRILDASHGVTAGIEACGDAALALQIAELGLARYPQSAALRQTRERALTTLRDIYAQTNPFRFIVYSEMAGRGLAPVALPAPAAPAQ